MKKIAVFGLASLAVLAAVYFGLTGYLEKKIKSQVDERLAELASSNGVSVGYDTLNVDLLAKNAVMSRVSVRSGESVTAVDKVTIYGVQNLENSLNLAATGIDLAGQNPAPEGTNAFPSPAKADLRIDFSYDPKGKVADLREFRLFVGNYFDLRLAATIIDPPTAVSNDNLLRFLLELGDTQILQAQLTYVDRNLLGYFLSDEARKTGATVEAVAARYDALIDAQIARYVQSGAKDMAAALTALKQFARDRKGIEIAACPETPVKIANLPKDEGETVALLRVRAKSL